MEKPDCKSVELGLHVAPLVIMRWPVFRRIYSEGIFCTNRFSFHPRLAQLWVHQVRQADGSNLGVGFQASYTEARHVGSADPVRFQVFLYGIMCDAHRTLVGFRM